MCNLYTLPKAIDTPREKRDGILQMGTDESFRFRNTVGAKNSFEHLNVACHFIETDSFDLDVPRLQTVL